LPPKPGVHATFARDYEYKRHGTLSLLAGIDLLTGKVQQDRGADPPRWRTDLRAVPQRATHRQGSRHSRHTRAENAFRDMKSPLAERPIFHHTERRTESHIFLCVLATRKFCSDNRGRLCLTPSGR
jgi:hypothetical protein